jgi:hypothetical protein
MAPALPLLGDRDVVFVSHANPEDNQFATWLTLRLAREGYRVWCDTVRLRGGHDFWRDIETAIRQHTRKFIFVTSRTSNQKPGTLQELAVAAGVARQLNHPSFVVPVKIDDLPYGEHNIQINRLNALSFTAGWAAGLAELIQTLQDDNVPAPELDGASRVAQWWNTHKLNKSILKRQPETLWTNWFGLKGLPRQLWVWDIPEGAILPETFAYPVHRAGARLFSFADAESLTLDGSSPTGGPGLSFRLNLRGDPPQKSRLQKHEVVTAVKQLLRGAWRRAVEDLGLPFFQLSGHRETLWVPKNDEVGDTVRFPSVDGNTGRRDLCGFRTIRRLNGETYPRYWHFGLEALPILYPAPVLALKSHVVFSLDGKQITGDAKTQHRARRSQCKDWWNDKWRDLTLAAVCHLTRGEPTLRLVVNSEDDLRMDWRPIKYQSAISYDDAEVRSEVSEDIRETSESEDDEAEAALA